VTGGCEQPDRNSKGLMMVRVSMAGVTAGFFVLALAAPFSTPLPALAQSEITVFAPFRGIATPIARAGSTVSVITREDIEQAGQTSVAELLRTVPGVSFTGAGGVSSQKDVRIRGTEAQHTMVLIDGVPVSETTSTRNTFDFRTLSANVVERIEVLRGPQSALYGSDAIGGVINIITRQASTGFSGAVTVEGGSFGTHREVLEASYGGDHFGVFGSLSYSATDGFNARDGNDESDGQTQVSGFLRGTLEVSEALRVDAQLLISDTESDYDSSGSRAFGLQSRQRIDGSVRVQHSSFDGRWRQTLTAFAGHSDLVDDFLPSSLTVRTTDFVGNRLGLDYTSTLDFAAFGTLLVGAGIEHQDAELDRRTSDAADFSGEDLYWNAFAMHQFSLGQNLHLSGAIRFDDFDDAGTFVTGRGTAVYEIFATETRLRASVGTGAKAPSLFQRFSTSGNPNLLPDESFGADVGVSQTLFDGRLTVDATAFYNEIENMLDYDSVTRVYQNIDNVETYGVEVAADARLIPGQLDASAHYTYLVATDLTTGDRLRRRPEHEGQINLTYFGIDDLVFTASALFAAGDHFSDAGEGTPLDPFIRFDLSASYQAHEHLELFGRVENLFDADYEERAGYNTPGVSAYAGIRATF
jgi:vitamin B12 transporter